MHEMLVGYGCLALAVLLEMAGQLMFKAGLPTPAPHTHDAHRVIAGTPLSPWIVAGIAVYVVELVVWIAALTLLPLSHAFPILTLSYAGVAIGSWFVFDEKLHGRAILGIALLTAGAALVAA